jgi:hypothetical protein
MLVGAALWLPRIRDTWKDASAQAGFMIVISAGPMTAGINVGGIVGQLVIAVGALMVVLAAVSIYQSRRSLGSASVEGSS